MHHYVLVIWGDVEPELLGPFPSKAKRDAKAHDLKREHEDQHGIYPLSVNAKGVPTISTYRPDPKASRDGD